MDRQQAKELLPIIQAFVEGKEIEYRSKGFNEEWREMHEMPGLSFDSYEYRIKPEPKYRPFANIDECWQEMQKHQPFGWVKKTCGNCNFLHIMELYSTGIVINNVDNFGCFKNLIKTYNVAFVETTFVDGTPFGIKEEKTMKQHPCEKCEYRNICAYFKKDICPIGEFNIYDE